jgi:preprotein translocase subunit YajC
MNVNGLNSLLADVPQQTMMPNKTGDSIKFFGIMAVMFLLMWFMIFQPQRKRAKELEIMLKALRAGDKIVTTSGIVGVVLALKDKTVSIRSSDAKLEILKSAIADVTERGGDTSAS